ncbi:peptidoglycan-binding protein LysM [Streptomyces albospinus]|uniref:Peptidoglycan-binding protein LysM n=1 Tax=Streptomyces albospinus TaxID=285515 RepID=A0ABQ2VKR7_9ACTN|nr:transglycosylase family protein [Streptomyces albospinus]GGU94714.1 peptidoglycan-binding protein LysM [Streptomyces albospinus]
MRSGNGRHRRPRQAPAIFVTAGVTGAGLALPLFAASGAHAADTGTWDKVAQCESGGVWSANAGNGFYGGLQLTQEMWDGYGGSAYASRPDLASRAQQIAVAESILDDRGPDAFPGCAGNAGLAKDGRAPDVNPGSTTRPSPRPSHSHTADPSDGSDDDSGTAGPSGSAPGPDSPGSADNGDQGNQGNQGNQGDNGDRGNQGDHGDHGDWGDHGDHGDKGDHPTDPTGPSATPTPSPSGSASPTPGDDRPTPSAPPGRGKHRGAPDDGEGKGNGNGNGKNGGKRGSGDGTGDGRGDDGKGAGAGRDEGRGGDPDRSSDGHASRGGDAHDTPPAAADRYLVRPGDTLSAIAGSHDLPGGWTALYDRNKDVVGADADLIRPGQLLDLGHGEG